MIPICPQRNRKYLGVDIINFVELTSGDYKLLMDQSLVIAKKKLFSKFIARKSR